MAAFITLASFATSIKEQTGGKIKDADLREILMSQSPLIDQIKKGEAKVYEKYNVTEKVFKSMCKKVYANDPVISGLQEEMKTTMDKAFNGIQPTMQSAIPDFLTPAKCLRILETMYKSCRKVAYRKMEGLRERGIRITPYDQTVIKATQEMEIEAEKAKQKVYKKYGIDELEESPSLLLHNAVQKFSETDSDFVMKVAHIERDYKMKMAMMMEGGLDEKEKQLMLQESDSEEEYFEDVDS